MVKMSGEKLGPQIKDPTENEIQETIRSVKNKYDVIIRSDDAIRYCKLTEELGWWMTARQEANTPEGITEEMINDVKENSTVEETRVKAKQAVIDTATAKMKQIREEIRELLGKYL